MHTDTEHEKDPRFEEARQHMKAARAAMRKSYESLLPPGFLESRRKARKEFLLAMRSIMDAAIERVEEAVKTD
jgi:hypothetical protein